MARRRHQRPDEDDEVTLADADLEKRPDTDPVSDEAELEREEEPADIRVDPLQEDQERGEAPSLAERAGAIARQALAGAGAAGVARGAALQAAMQPRLARLLITIVGGLLLCASFPSLSWWWGAVVAAALLAWVLKHPATTVMGGLGYGFLFGLAFYLPLLPWISLLVGTVPWLALVWAAQEWLKSIFPFGGFPWGSVAFGQAEGPLLPLVKLGGVALLSTAVVLVGFSATAIALEIVKWWRPGGHARASAFDTASETEVEKADQPPPAVVLPGICICLVLLAAVIIWPQVRHAGAGSGGEPTVTVAAVQGNVPRLGFDFNAQRRAVLDNHVQETLRLAEDVRAGAAPQPQMGIWPEDSSDIDPFLNADAGQQIAQAAHAIGAPILIGTILDVPGRNQEPAEYTNTLIVWNPVTGPADRHDKEIVQPFGEYLPMPWLFKHLSGYADRAG